MSEARSRWSPYSSKNQPAACYEPPGLSWRRKSISFIGRLVSSFSNMPVNQLGFEFFKSWELEYDEGFGSGYGSSNSVVVFHQRLVVLLILARVEVFERE